MLVCPRCGHRTDEPGTGVLGDGFDLLHRQWGLRGDPHVWWAIQELVGSVPTPSTTEEVRQVFVDAVRQVADVDLDQTEESSVHRRDLDHGGMLGGMVDVGWWRTKGIPLLVERAWERRPPADPAPERAQPSSGLRARLAAALVWAVLLAIPAGLVGGGLSLLYQAAWGTRVEATVLSCDRSGGVFGGAATYRTDCVAEWTVDGRVVVGGFDGGNGESDVGKTVEATVRGDTAYSRSLVLPIVLLVLGVPFLILPLLAVGRRLRDRTSG